MDSENRTPAWKKVLCVLAGIAYLCGGAAILVWDAGKLRKANEAADWPKAEGIVTRSGISSPGKERHAEVDYTYAVQGTAYTSRRISFALFDSPGGAGSGETLLKRYPAGTKVTVQYDPALPGSAILEPADKAVFYPPLLFGGILFFGGVMTFRQAWRSSLPRGLMSRRRRLGATVAVSALIYATMVLTFLRADVSEVFVKAFGERPLGIPCTVAVFCVITLLYLPMPWIFHHGMNLAFHAIGEGKGVRLTYLLAKPLRHGPLRRSRNIVIGGLVYVVALCVAWGVYLSRRGI
jgi:hypothetical protein